MIYFLDTNICIYYLKGSSPRLRQIVEQTPVESIKIPSIVAAELLYGAEKSARREENLKKHEAFLYLHDIIPFDDKAAPYYALIRADLERKGRLIGNNDMMIAATVLAANGVLITHNIDEFSRVSGLTVNDWT